MAYRCAMLRKSNAVRTVGRTPCRGEASTSSSVHRSESLNSIRSDILVAAASFDSLIPTLPFRAKNSRQAALQNKHGTPRQFAQACVGALGEISVLEAQDAISHYLNEWNGVKG